MYSTTQVLRFLNFLLISSLAASFRLVRPFQQHWRDGGSGPLFSTFLSNVNVQVVSEMPPPLSSNLKNHYCLLRHGQSTANVAGIISSDRLLAHSDKHGLTELGYQQGRASAKQLVSLIRQQSPQAGQRIVFVASPFARARQTAQASLDGLLQDEFCRNELETLGLQLSTDIVLEDRLMERFFGRLDNEAIYTYAYVWPVDKLNTTHTAFDVESVAAVATRLRDLVDDHESTYDNTHIVWTSHADVLQIAQVYAADYDKVGSFSSYRFGNGEVRVMKPGNASSLPSPVPLQPLDRTI